MRSLSALKSHVQELEERMEELEVRGAELDQELLRLNPPKPALDFVQLDYRKTRLTPDVRVWKDECCMSFATPYSPGGGGLFLNLCSLSSFSLPFVRANSLQHQQHNNSNGKRPVYLHQEWLWVESTHNKKEEEEAAAPKRLAIAAGQDEPGASSSGTCEKVYSIRVGPDFSLAYAVDDAPADLRQLVQSLIAREDASRQTEVQAWEATQDLQESRFARQLVQLANPPVIPSNPALWRCQESGIQENLWLNLSDGYIGSGRANWDGTGGTGAALKHFHDTGARFPLAVKLGTISKDGKTADVYSYAEDDMVLDPLLPQHLAHFGIVPAQLDKTDKTVSEMEVDLNSTYDWSRISQEGENLAKVWGAHCVGLENLGNSCYCNSVLQLLFGSEQFDSRVCDLVSSTQQPERDLATQLVKLSNALNDPVQHVRPLLAPHQLAERGEEQDYVSPRMLRHVLGENHREFSGREQQDACEYVLHVLDRIRRVNGGGAAVADLFRFQLEQRSVCAQSGRVKYSLVKDQLMLPVNVNDAFTSLHECLRATLGQGAVERVDGFLSPETGAQGRLDRTLAVQSFPRLLLVQLKRFVLKDDQSWEAVKLDGKIPLPGELDLGEFASKGLQPGEERMRASSGAAAQDVAAAPFAASEEVVLSVLDMGFSREAAVRAAKATNNSGVEQAMQWVMEHLEDADFNDPLPQQDQPSAAAAAASAPPSELVEMLQAMGFDSAVAQFALQQCGNNVERAADFLFSRSAEELDAAMLATTTATTATAVQQEQEEEPGTASAPHSRTRYRLRAVVSHIGKSTHSGHYVCHYNQSPAGQPARWVFFNDAKVVLANHPPLDLGYLALYEQDQD